MNDSLKKIRFHDAQKLLSPTGKTARFNINTKSVYTSRYEGCDENFVSPSRRKLFPLTAISAKNLRKWFQRAGVIHFFKNWPAFNFMNGVH